MECKIVTFQEIKKDNPRLCLLPLRYLGKCYQCEGYTTCESKIITPEGDLILKDIATKRGQIKQLKKELEELKKQ